MEAIRNKMPEVMTARISIRKVYRMLDLDWTDADAEAWDANGITHLRFVPINLAEEIRAFFQDFQEPEGEHIHDDEEEIEPEYNPDFGDITEEELDEILRQWDDDTDDADPF